MATGELARTTNALPEHVAKRGINEAQWLTLCNSLFPGAKPQSVLMVLDYCASRKLDPMKKPCHIVPMRVKDPQTGNYEWRDVVMPGIYEYRTTAMRTGLYLGHSEPTYGPVVEHFPKFEAPDWCAMTIYRRASNGERIEFPVRVYFRESVKLKDGRPNDRWATAPIQMLTKCCEAAGLREAFPDEFGGEQTAEEMEGVTIEAETVKPPQPAQRVSQQSTPAPSQAEASPQKSPAPAAADATSNPGGSPAPAPVKNIGLVVEVVDKGNGAALIVLNTGLKAATTNAEIIQAAASLRDSKRRVEMEIRPSKKAGNAPVIVAIEPGSDGAS